MTILHITKKKICHTYSINAFYHLNFILCSLNELLENYFRHCFLHMGTYNQECTHEIGVAKAAFPSELHSLHCFVLRDVHVFSHRVGGSLCYGGHYWYSFLGMPLPSPGWSSRLLPPLTSSSGHTQTGVPYSCTCLQGSQGGSQFWRFLQRIKT